ncbi:MAG: hypothetical protein MSS84_00255 [Bacteroidales bacterium]|nr:hypothetical protein [Bacteroidales bacterium]
MVMPSTAWAQDVTYTNGFGSDGSYQQATLTTDKYDINGDNTKDEVYEIGNAGQLYWFAGLVNGTLSGVDKNLSANAVLTANITVNKDVLNANGQPNGSEDAFREWTPIGQSFSKAYSGTFDGQGHTISGLWHWWSTDYIGLFGNNEGTIKNLGVVDSYLSGHENVGGVCGKNGGSLTNCYNTGPIYGVNYIGGVCGMNSGSLTNCYNTGNVRGNETVGGVCGGTNGGSFTNCYNTGNVQGNKNVGGVCGRNDGNHPNFTNCYYLSGTATGGINGADVEGSAEVKTQEQFGSGEVCYLLNGSSPYGEWGQQLGTDPYPVLGGLPVYYRDEVYTNTYGILTIGTQTITASNEPLVWYEFTPSETASYKFSSTQLTAGNLYVNTTKTESDYTDIATSPTYDLEAATTYYVAVSGAPGSYDLTITRLNNTPTAIETVTAPQIYAVDGRIVCEGEFRIYDLLGRDVTYLNGSLCGVYVVKTADAAQKVIVK